MRTPLPLSLLALAATGLLACSEGSSSLTGSTPLGAKLDPAGRGGIRSQVPSTSGGPDLADFSSLSYTAIEPDPSSGQPADGEIRHQHPAQAKWQAEIICVDVVDSNTAFFAGQITSPPDFAGSFVLYQVEDNGTSARKFPRDQVAWEITGDEGHVSDFCDGSAFTPSSGLMDVVGGNLSVKLN